jgi:hypothetical protein
MLPIVSVNPENIKRFLSPPKAKCLFLELKGDLSLSEFATLPTVVLRGKQLTC